MRDQPGLPGKCVSAYLDSVSDLLEHLRSVVADRYVVEREIGRGGMSTVFLAQERQPRRRVAIKVLNPDIASHLVRERFLREIEVGSNLTHPHIVPIFTAGDADGLLYYVMPFIEGQSLRSRLGDDHPLEPDAAIDVTLEVASALQYAHEKGVIHRDIKPENILLVGDHAVVVDFGVARAIGAAHGEKLTESGLAIGTPGYMSSEQWSGTTEVDGRADIYSLGCVLLEMLEGRLPDGDPALLFRTEPALLSTLQRPPRIPPELRPVLRRALAADREDRFATATDFSRAIQDATGRLLRRHHPMWPRLLLAAASVLFVLALGIRFWPRSVSQAPEPRVVVAAFDNQTGDSTLGSIATIASDWITRGLSRTGLVEVVDTRTSLAISGSGSSMLAAGADEGVKAVGRQAQAGIVVWGYYYRENELLRFEVEISDARRGTLLRALDPVVGPIDTPLVAIETVRQRVMGAMATLFDNRFSAWTDVAAQPPSFDAYEDYIDGLTLVLQTRQQEGLPLLYRAATLDTSFITPVLFAAYAHTTLNQWSEADSLIHVVHSRRERLTPFNRLLLDWMRALIDGDIPAQLEYARDMVELAPGAESQTLLGSSALAANRPNEALVALSSLDPHQGLLKGFSLYWDHMTIGLHLLGRHRRELDAARNGRSQYPYDFSMVEHEMRALAALGRLAELDSVANTLIALPADPRWSGGEILRRTALELRAHGHGDAARPMLDQALQWYRSLPPIESTRESFRHGLALALYEVADFAAAEELALKLTREHPDSISYHGLLGVVYARRQNWDEAHSIAEWLQELDRPYLFGTASYWQARIAAVFGGGELAISLLPQAFSEGRPFDLDFHVNSDFSSLSDQPALREFLRPKG